MDFQSHRRKETYSKIKGDSHFGKKLIENYMEMCFKKMKNNSAIYCFCSWHNVDFFKINFEKWFKLKNIIIWNKNNHGSGDLKGAYAPKYEMVLYGHKGRSLFREKRITDVIDFQKIPGSKTVHPTEKPVGLIEIFLKNNSDIGNICFDGFMGSGSTGVAAMNTGRKFIGIELDKNYFDIAEDRIKKAYKEAKK